MWEFGAHPLLGFQPPEGHAYRLAVVGIVVSCTAVNVYPHTIIHRRSHLYLCVAPRAASLAGGAPPGGACRRPPLPGVYIYMLYLTCRLPKVDMSVTEVVYTTKVVYLPVLINLGSQFDS